MTAPPFDANLDTATAAHRLLDRLPEWKRTAAAALLDLPPDTFVSHIVDPDTGEVVGQLTAGTLLIELRCDVASPDTVWRLLEQRRLVRPGLGGTS